MLALCLPVFPRLLPFLVKSGKSAGEFHLLIVIPVVILVFSSFSCCFLIGSFFFFFAFIIICLVKNFPCSKLRIQHLDSILSVSLSYPLFSLNKKKLSRMSDFCPSYKYVCARAHTHTHTRSVSPELCWNHLEYSSELHTSHICLYLKNVNGDIELHPWYQRFLPNSLFGALLLICFCF